jgi:hypothetical protein
MINNFKRRSKQGLKHSFLHTMKLQTFLCSEIQPLLAGWLKIRVTGLGEFLPFGRLLTLCSFLKITQAAQNFWAPFPTENQF